MLLVCGEALFDVFIEIDTAEATGACAMLAVPGGSPFNVAVGLSRLDVPVALATDLGRDQLGARLVGRLIREGICDALVRRSRSGTALALVTVDERGVPAYDFRGLEETTFAPPQAELEARMPEISGLHIISIALVLERSSDYLITLARRLTNDKLVSLDPNVRLSIEPCRERWRDIIERVRPSAHLVKVSEEDLVCIYGSEMNPELLCESWLSENTQLVVLTRGERGSLMFTRSVAPIPMPVMPVPVVDTVGAGDSFMAALLTRLRQQDRFSAQGLASQTAGELQDLGRFATAAVTLTCSRRGPALPRLAEVETLLASLPV